MTAPHSPPERRPTEQVLRAARLVRMRDFVLAVPQFSTADLASRFDVSQRTAERDLSVLESDLGVPLVSLGEGGRWRYRVFGGET